MPDELITGEVFGREAEGPRALLLAESEKPISELRPAVVTADALVMRALAGVSEAQSRFEPPTGEGEDAWSIAQVVHHLIVSESRGAVRIRRLADGVQTPASFWTPAPLDDRPFAELVSALASAQAALLASADAIDGQDRTDTRDHHIFFGELNARGWFRMHALHATDHARQIERLKALPGFPQP